MTIFLLFFLTFQFFHSLSLLAISLGLWIRKPIPPIFSSLLSLFSDPLLYLTASTTASKQQVLSPFHSFIFYPMIFSNYYCYYIIICEIRLCLFVCFYVVGRKEIIEMMYVYEMKILDVRLRILVFVSIHRYLHQLQFCFLS